MADAEIIALREKLASRSRSDDYRQRRRDIDARGLQYGLKADVKVEPVTANGVRAEWTSTPQDNSDAALLYLHGGGYVIGSLDSHRHLVAEAGRDAGCWALALDYRLAPENPFPAAVEDAVAGYRYLLARGLKPGRIAIAGDSAGGGLVVAAMLAIRDAGLPQPGCGWCISPWVDMEATGETMVSKSAVDPTVQKAGILDMARLYLSAANPRSPLAAPIYADLAGIPPLLIQVGAVETLLDDAIRLARVAGAADVRVDLQIWPEMIHVWHLFHPELKAGRRAIEEGGAFVRAHTAKPQVFEAAKPRLAPAIGPSRLGQWSKSFNLDNVAIHAHLLPTGKVLYWGRRKEFGSPVFATLNDHACQTYVWDPATGVSTPTKNQPVLKDGTPVNLFCSGHTFLADGRLMVVGGHLFDSQGVNQSCIYDPATDTWTAEALMNNGRWYPSAITLPDGGVLVLSGSFATGPLQPPPNGNVVNPTPQVWRGTGWESLTDFEDGLTLFPRFHIEPKKGQVFMSGAQGESFFFDVTGGGTWTGGPLRALGLRDYAPSVMYDTGKVIFAGGGLDAGTGLPTNGVETIDLTAAAPAWHMSSPMHFRRRQHNATILPDGTVLVTGGTQGPNFNDVDPGSPIHAAELWDPNTGTWTVLAEEAVDRCYHATAVLLPDGRVLSAGGGEYAPTNNVANPANDTHVDAQLFSPPYLFRGPRPTFSGAPDELFYAESFELQVAQADAIAKVTWIRLGSVTHSFDQNQRMNTLAYKKGRGTLTVTAPENAHVCPPGHYMLFVVDDKGVPSVGHIARISARQVVAAALAHSTRVHNVVFNEVRPGPLEKDALTVQAAAKPAVTVGITPTCLYGLAGCWGGAKGALRRLTGIETVLEEANAYTSTASVFLKDDALPDLDIWRREFAHIANASYTLRGIEITLSGTVEHANGLLRLVGNVNRPSVLLAPLAASNKVQWNFATKSNWPLEPDEETAYSRLQQKLMGPAPPISATVTGTLLKNENGFFLEVRTFAA